ncbi:hypothetical protein FPOAC2_04923 [Fusarium poae]|jgi:hypothetical protein
MVIFDADERGRPGRTVKSWQNSNSHACDFSEWRFYIEVVAGQLNNIFAEFSAVLAYFSIAAGRENICLFSSPLTSADTVLASTSASIILYSSFVASFLHSRAE